jgi:hypothetical protein
MTRTPAATVLSLAQLLEQQSPAPPPCLVEPGLLPAQGILFVGGEPKVGKSLLVANLALSLATASDRLGFPVPAPRRALVCQFELAAIRAHLRGAVEPAPAFIVRGPYRWVRHPWYLGAIMLLWPAADVSSDRLR